MTSEQSAYGQYTIAGEGRKPRETESSSKSEDSPRTEVQTEYVEKEKQYMIKMI